MNLIIQYGLLGLVLGLGLGLGFILYCRIWRPLALPYMCPQPGCGHMYGSARGRQILQSIYIIESVRLFVCLFVRGKRQSYGTD